MITVRQQSRSEKKKNYKKIEYNSHLINFYKSLPIEFQIHEPEHYIDNIAYLRERFLFAYLLAKMDDDSIVYFTGRNTTFHDYESLNYLRKEIVSRIAS